MDQEKFVSLLNEDLELEFRSIVLYVQHTATIKGAEHLSTIAELRRHLTEELHHCEVLAEQVDFLGGTPSTTVPADPASPSDAIEALKVDLALETRQLERYRERVEQAEELNLADVAESLRPLLTQTQEHVRDLETILG